MLIVGMVFFHLIVEVRYSLDTTLSYTYNVGRFPR